MKRDTIGRDALTARSFTAKEWTIRAKPNLEPAKEGAKGGN